MNTFLVLVFLWTIAICPLQPPRLIVLGDSIGVGVGASEPSKSFARIVAARLGRMLDNRAIGGTTIAEQTIPLDLHAGDVVVWLSGYNDMRAGNDPIAYGRKLEAAVAAMRSQGARVYVGRCLAMTSEGYSMYGPRWNKGSDELVKAYHSVTPYTVEIQYDPKNVVADLVHPNDLGHSQIAKSFLQVIGEKIYFPLFRVQTKSR